MKNIYAYFYIRSLHRDINSSFHCCYRKLKVSCPVYFQPYFTQEKDEGNLCPVFAQLWAKNPGSIHCAGQCCGAAARTGVRTAKFQEQVVHRREFSSDSPGVQGFCGLNLAQQCLHGLQAMRRQQC